MPVDLDKLERMRQAADLDPLLSTHITSPGYTHMANLTEKIGEDGNPRGRCIAMIPKEWSDYIAEAVNATPVLVAEVRALQEDKKRLLIMIDHVRDRKVVDDGTR